MRIIQIILGIISLIFGIFALVFFDILPLMGIHFDYNSSGASMEPALTDSVSIRFSPERAPFEDLQVGDIILFRKIDYQDNNMPPGIVYTPEWNEDHTMLRLVHQTDEPLKYRLINHRIIAINEDGLVTKGDNNEYQDALPVKSEEYLGKTVWHLNYVNKLFKAMYLYGLWAECTILFLVVSLFLWYVGGSA